MSLTKDNKDSIPFPALTPAQRFYLEVNGYVVIENVLSCEEVEALVDTTYAIEKRYRKNGELPGPSSHFSSTSEDCFRIDNLPHLAPCYFDYLTHPRLLGMVQEIVGGTVRLEQSDAHIRRPVPGGIDKIPFHRGLNPGYCHTAKGLYHFSFVKTLTNLTDLGPDDGGTTVIAGSHKVTEVSDDTIIAAAMADPRLIHHMEAPAGSTLLLFESLVHASGIIKSERDRLLIIGGYTPTMFQAYVGYDADPKFAQELEEEQRALLTGEKKFRWERRVRNLETPAEAF